MPYTASIDRRNPGCVLFLVDQSTSMIGTLAGQSGLTKMNAAADAVNRVIDTLVQRCSQGIEIRDYFDIGILGYGHALRLPDDPSIESYLILNKDEKTGQIIHKNDPRFNEMWPVEESIISVFPGTSVESPFLSISLVAEAAELEDRQVRESDGEGVVIEVTRKVPMWVHPHCGLETPMRRALLHTAQAVGQWIVRHPQSFPPIVINISDGESSDGDPEPVAQQIMNLHTSDGNVLLFNCHLSESAAAPIQYPERESALHHWHARQMFRMSSVMPEGARAHAFRLGIPVSEQSRCCVFNADIASLVQFLDIGTRGPVTLR